MTPQQRETYLNSNSQLLADKLGHLCKTCMPNDPTKGGRCCQGCAQYKGHFTWWDKEHPDIQRLVTATRYAGFDLIKGFLGPNGCKLPRELRSDTCRTYTCETWKEHADKTTVGQAKRIWMLAYHPNKT